MKKVLLGVILLSLFGVMFAQNKVGGIEAKKSLSSFIIFDGTKWTSFVTPSAWNSSTIDIVADEGLPKETKAVKWNQGGGWTGFYVDVNPVFDLSGIWATDSCKFMCKSEAEVGAIRLQLCSVDGNKYGKVFTPAGDNQWHQYSFALSDLEFQDGSTSFNKSGVNKIEFMAEGTGNSGKNVWITNWWIGSPVFDTTPPEAPKNLTSTTSKYMNTIMWQDVPGEDYEKYDIYFSTKPITDISEAEIVALNVAEGTQLITHKLRIPLDDKDITYYYAIVCRDAYNNASKVSQSLAITNAAEGVPTVSLSTPKFVADGDLSEWAGIKPFKLALSDGSGYLADNTKIDNDADCSGMAYVAVDNDYLYVAFSVKDDQITPDISTTTYLNDGADIFIGLYDWHGSPHSAFKAGTEPDIQLRFNKNQAILATAVTSKYDSLLLPGENYYWGETFPSGYISEARIPLDSIPARIAGTTKFVPKNGMRVPVDFSINDADGAEREGILCYSPNNNDRSAGGPVYWSYTWIGDKTTTGVADNNITLDNYQLMQNYPNPFNPATQISYVLSKQGMVTVKVFDILGREVKTLVNQEQASGLHTVNFDASGLASGMYIYKIEAGSFTSSKKMLFLK
jgi:hypothetical protein